MTKAAQVTIKELNQVEIDRLLADTIYSRFVPIKCNQCGKTAFSRRVFHIMGVQEDEYCDDSMQNMLRHHFFNRHKIEFVFFRGNRDKFYADSAICLACKSTAVVFDITFDDAVIGALANKVGEDPKLLKDKLEALAKALEVRGEH